MFGASNVRPQEPISPRERNYGEPSDSSISHARGASQCAMAGCAQHSHESAKVRGGASNRRPEIPGPDPSSPARPRGAARQRCGCDRQSALRGACPCWSACVLRAALERGFLLGQRVLVLNASYEPLQLVSTRRAIVLLLQEKAEVIEATEQRLRAHSLFLDIPHVIR